MIQRGGLNGVEAYCTNCRAAIVDQNIQVGRIRERRDDRWRRTRGVRSAPRHSSLRPWGHGSWSRPSFGRSPRERSSIVRSSGAARRSMAVPGSRSGSCIRTSVSRTDRGRRRAVGDGKCDGIPATVKQEPVTSVELVLKSHPLHWSRARFRPLTFLVSCKWSPTRPRRGPPLPQPVIAESRYVIRKSCGAGRPTLTSPRIFSACKPTNRLFPRVAPRSCQAPRSPFRHHPGPALRSGCRAPRSPLATRR